MFALVYLLPYMVAAQSSNDLEKQYEEFRKQAKKEYSDFRRECNRAYAEFMLKAWKEFQASEPIPIPEEKNVPIVVHPEEDKGAPIPTTPLDEKKPDVTVVPMPETIPQPLPVAPVKEEPQPMDQYFAFTFYGTDCKVRLDDRHRFNLPYCNEKAIAKVWEECSSTIYNNVIRDCLELRIRHSLCDWAYLQMLQTLGESFFGKGSDEATLLTAYLYCQSGYKMRLAHDKQHLYLLVASRHTIYGHKYYTIDGDNYYLLKEKNDAPLFICEASFPKEQALSLWMEQSPTLELKQTDYHSLQSKRYPEIQVEVYGNSNLLAFYASYPPSEIENNKMTRWAMYAQTPLSKETRESLYPVLKERLNGLTETDAANRLLNFVQTAFEYGYDEEQWGEERAFFAEETMHYPYSDCEDRAILFSHLMRDLLGLDVALVYYPGHLATAVCFNEEVRGDYLTIDNRRFVVCDPTYINASIGESMPTVDSNNIMITVLKRNSYEEDYTIDVATDTEAKDETKPTNEEQKDTANITKVKQSLFPICVDGKWGYKNVEGEIVVPCEYDSVSGYERGDRYAYVAHENGLMDLYDYRGRKLGNATSVLDYIPTVLWHSETDTIDAQVLVKLEWGWDYLGFADHSSYDIENEYDFSDINGQNFESNISSITTINGEIRHFIILKQKKNNKFGVFEFWPTHNHVDEHIFIPFIYDSITFVKGDKSKVEVYSAETGERKVISLIEKDNCEDKNMILSDSCLSKKTNIKQSLFPICVDGKWGYKNVEGEIVVPCEYDSVSGYERGDRFPYAAHKNGKIDLYHGEDRGKYEKVFSDLVDYIPLALKWKLGTVNPDKDINISPLATIWLIMKLEWEWADKVEQKWISQEWVVECGWTCYDGLDMDNVSYDNHVFENDEVAYLIVKQLSNNKWGVIPYDYDSREDKGKEKIPFIYDSITFVKGDKSKVEVYGAETGERKVISLIEKDNCEDKNMILSDSCLSKKTNIKQSLFPICVDGKWGYKNVEGEIVVPCEYDSVSGYERGDRFPYAAHKNGLIALFHGELNGDKFSIGASHNGCVEGYIPMPKGWKLYRSSSTTQPWPGVWLIIKLDGEWLYGDYIHMAEIGRSYDGLDMDNVSYDTHVFENDEVAYIIVKQLSNNKWGVIPYDYDSREDEKIPFIYDSITFVKGDKSKVEVYGAETGERKVISLVE